VIVGAWRRVDTTVPMWRIAVAAALIVCLLVAAKNGHVLRDAGLKGTCASASTPSGGQPGTWKLCKRGRLDGRPDLTRQGCTAGKPRGNLQYWRCPAQIGSSVGT
jgi:hypothetical protein